MAGGAQDSDDTITGINVTPLVDITLVLLIIFMVTAKLIVQGQGIPLDLPKAASGTEIQSVFSVVLAADGVMQVDSKTVANDDAILDLARQAHAKNPDLRAVIKADKDVSHGRVMKALGLLKKAEITKIAFGVAPDETTAPTKP